MKLIALTWRSPGRVTYEYRRDPVPGVHRRRWYRVDELRDRALGPWSWFRRCKANKRMSSQIMRARYRQEDRAARLA